MVFRSGKAEWREAQHRCVDRNEAAPAWKSRPKMNGSDAEQFDYEQNENTEGRRIVI